MLKIVWNVDGISVWQPLCTNQLKSAPSQLLPVFFRISLVANLLPLIWTSQYPLFFFQVPDNFFFIVMTTGQELGQ
jgi:hypothetical protein